MKKPDIKSLFTPFVGSVAHKVVAVAAALLLTAGLILCAHLILHDDSPKADDTSSSQSEVAL
ncbi:MAG: hypothetical protein IKL44_02885 [Clostridia bacterium]|nr:hypothetical protein [Clostridia bacterium]MBR3593600.1 hypothetical protein [Clostridia bacterium]